MTEVTIEAYIVKWAGKYVLVPKSDRGVLKALVNRRVKLTVVSDIGVYMIETTLSENPQYGAMAILPKRMRPTWERLHEKTLKAVIEVGDNGGY
jgi:hypothetical protein